MFNLKQINNERVNPIPIPSSQDTRPVRGGSICPEVYSNVFLCAKKKSGKTSAIFTIMKKCCDKRTKIVIYCSTIYKDENWIQIVKYFEDRGNDVQCFTSINEDGEDQLANLIDDLGESPEKEKATESQPYIQQKADPSDDIFEKLNIMHTKSKGQVSAKENYEIMEQEKQPEKKERKSKFKCQDYMIIFDDLSSELKSRSLLSLLKKNRHYRAKLIISSQWLHDLLPQSRRQIDVFMVFAGFSEPKIKEVYKDCDTKIPFDVFYKCYKEATDKEYSFMYIDSRSDTLRCCFDKEFVI